MDAVSVQITKPPSKKMIKTAVETDQKSLTHNENEEHIHEVHYKTNSRFGRTTRLYTMLFMVVGFCAVEFIVGHLADSLALVADSFHMLSDALALIVAAMAINFGKTTNKVRND